MKTDDRVQARYTGSATEHYDAERKSTARYRAEEDAFSSLFATVQPRFVIDCPFGTGRWLDFYRAKEVEVVAVDLSPDMLAVAEKKLGADIPARGTFHLIVGSAFDHDFAQYASRAPDLLVCTRFLNWVDVRMAQAALENLSSCGARWAIIGVSVRPSSSSRLGRLTRKVRLAVDNWRRARSNQAIQHVHDEDVILSAFRRAGWSAVEKRHIFSSPTRENFFWLLRRDS